MRVLARKGRNLWYDRRTGCGCERDPDIRLMRKFLILFIRLKTGALIEAAMMIGAILGGSIRRRSEEYAEQSQERSEWHSRSRTIFWM